MRILYYSTSYYANHGGSIQSIEFYKRLDEQPGISSKSLFPDLREEKEDWPARMQRFFLKTRLKKSSLLQVLFFYRRNRFFLRKLSTRIREYRPDVVLMQIDSNFLQIGFLKKHFPEIMVVTQVNGSPFDEPFRNIAFKAYFLRKQQEAYRQADLNIFISEYSRKAILGAFLDPERDVVIHNGTDTKKFFPVKDRQHLRKTLSYPQQAFILGYVGTLDHHKKLELLISVFATLKRDHPELLLVIIGDGPALPRIKKTVREKGLEEEVILRGWLEHRVINEHINCFDIAVHHYANTYMNPLKIFEYLSAGLPVIAPDIPSVRSLFRDGEDLLITLPEEMELQKNLQRLLEDRALREKLSHKEELIRDLSRNFTWDRYAEKIIHRLQERRRTRLHQ